MQTQSAKYGFGRLIDLARAEPIVVTKHGRLVVVVLAIEEYERLTTLDVVEQRQAEMRHECSKM